MVNETLLLFGANSNALPTKLTKSSLLHPSIGFKGKIGKFVEQEKLNLSAGIGPRIEAQ